MEANKSGRTVEFLSGTELLLYLEKHLIGLYELYMTSPLWYRTDKI